MSKKIAMIAYTQLKYDSRVIREALAAAEAGFEVDFFTLKEEEPTVISGVNVIYSRASQFRGNSKFAFIGNYLRFFMFCMWQVTKRHFKKRYGVIHVNNMPNFLVFCCIIPRIFGAKVILDIHDLVPELFAEKFHLPLNHLLIKLLYIEERFSARFAHMVISTNRLHNKRFTKNKIRNKEFPIILNASDETIFKPYAQQDFFQDQVVLIFPSTIAHRLGLDILVNAMELVVKQQDNICLKIYGDGEYKESLVNLIVEKNLQENVKFLGLVDHQTLSREYEKCHIGVIPWPSNYSTNYQMPIKINEYFTKGLATIASDVRILKEYFADCTMFFRAGDPEDFADKILYLANHREHMAEIAKKGHEFYLDNTWTKYKTDYQNILKSLSN